MSPLKKKTNPPGCHATSCDRLHLADEDLVGKIARLAGEPHNKFVRRYYLVVWLEEGCRECYSTPFPCPGQAEQWIRDHLLPAMMKKGLEAVAEIVVETTFSVREHYATRHLRPRRSRGKAEA